jgi:glycosyltransferase involved in cell wall biosynthesis
VEPQTNLNKSPRIGIVSWLDSPGGVQSVVLSLIKGLNQRGILPDLLWDVPPDTKLLEAKDARAGFQPIHFTAPSPLLRGVSSTARYLMNLANIIRSQQIVEHYDFYYIFYNGFLVNDHTPHIRYLSGPPLLPQLELSSPGLRGVPFRFLRWLYGAGLRHIFPAYEFHRDSRYVINSLYTAQLFEEAHGVRLPVVHPPIDLSGRSFAAEDLAQRDTVTFFSRLVDYKRPEMVLELARCYPAYRFVLMGGVKPQNQQYFAALQQKARADQNVSFFDNPSDSKVREELARTRFYVFPAMKEHFGMATAEAIASGAVPFVHDSGGQREVVPDPRLRFTDEQFFDRFADLLRLSPEQLNEIRFELREHVGQFSEEAFIAKMLSLLDTR